ncbi:hypothetical protein ACUN9V_05675 [Salinicola sp. V024]|uniref:hypothetical protein n=1 Tax=Salinicola sp. V024 TaxID=3459609 RepID=UPI0040442068
MTTLAEARNELAAALATGEGWIASPIIPLRLVELEDGWLVAGVTDPPIRKTRAVRMAIKPLEPTYNGKFIMYQQVSAPWYGQRFGWHQLEILDGLIEAEFQ